MICRKGHLIEYKNVRCRLCYNEYMREWRAKHPGYINVTLQNKEYRLRKKLEYRIRYREKLSLKERERRRLNPDKFRISDRNHKLKRKNIIGTHTLNEVKNILIKQENKCPFCKVKISFKPRNNELKAHVDHIMPISKGGDNYIKNIQILCFRCNLNKSSSHPIDWAIRNGRLV